MNFTEEQIACQDERRWWIFLVTSIGSYLGCLKIALALTLFSYVCCSSKKNSKLTPGVEQLGTSPFRSEVREWAAGLCSGQNTTGRILVVLVFLCNVIAVIIYIIDTGSGLIEECKSWVDSITLQIDFALGVVFLMHFFLRLSATDTLLNFMTGIDTIVDFFTLPPLFLSVWMTHTWIGLRCMRCLMLLQLPDVLVYVRVLSNSNSIRLSQLVSSIIGIWLWFAGVMFLAENTGDPFHNYENKREAGDMRYGDALYYLLITASTIGYGDYYPLTDTGKVLACLYLAGAIATFASYLPEIAELVGNQPKYAGSYKFNNQRQFVIVCGNINYESVNGFLKDFFHPAREDVNCEVVFLNKANPDLEFEGLLKRERTRVTYFQGTMLSPFDLQRVCVDRASAVLVLCNKFSTDPTSEDAANIMRTISVKNYCESTRVVVQLLHYSSKTYLLNIPGWDWRRDDQAVCLNEVKFGLLAQSCLAPGFFTLGINILATTARHRRKPEMPKWKADYLMNVHKVILAETLSPTFVGCTFSEVAEICYTRMNLILVAVEARKYEGGDIWINPRNKRITANAIGLFLTESSDAAKRAWFFCRVCHENISDPKEIKKCSCKRLAKERYQAVTSGKDHRLSQPNGIQNHLISTDLQEEEEAMLRRRRRGSKDDSGSTGNKSESAKMKFDTTGYFHWCTSRTIEECTLTREEATVTMFTGHIIITFFAEEDSPMLGLRNLIMPLRASNIHFSDLRHVIVVGNYNYIRREWPLLRNLPKISVMDGSPLRRADLRAVKVNLCRTCIILSSKTPEKSEPVLADKEIIMAALNIKSMDFGDNFDKVGEDDDEEQAVGEVNTNSVPILLDLAFANNVRYLDDQEMYMSDVELYKTLPFASGVAMARGILDSLMSAAYFNASALRLLRQWVTGGANIDLEKSLAEGAGLRGGYSTPFTLAARDRMKVEEIVLKESQWSRYAEYGAKFVDLYRACLREAGTLCIGIYRLMEEDGDGDSEVYDDTVRIVIGCPDNTTTLQPGDHIIALSQWEEDKEKTE